jgi:hypothetical protein
VKMKSSAEDYNTEFRKHAKKTGFSDQDLADRYKQRLNDTILRSVYGLGTLPASLQEWMDRALHFNRLQEQLGQIRSTALGTSVYWPRTSSTNPRSVKTQVRVESDYRPGTTGPMDIDTTRHENKCRHHQENPSFT